MASWARGLLEPLDLVAGSLDSWSLGRALGGGFGSPKPLLKSLWRWLGVFQSFPGQLLEATWRLPEPSWRDELSESLSLRSDEKSRFLGSWALGIS